MTGTPAVEFSRPVAVDSLEPGEQRRRIEATAAERAALAARFGLVAIDSLAADLVLTRPRRDLVEMTGTLEAEVVQTCVVSLQDFPARVAEPVDLVFTEEAALPPAAGEDLEDEEDPDSEPPEPIVDGRVDLGEAVAQQLALALDPFPHAPGITFAGYAVHGGSGGPGEGAGEGAGADPNPFAKLAALKEKL
ncbi:MAG: DUF177 domain-containing protein [Hyphomicrobiales bacterium]|nr:DUF177 domain-containing protein [Hyphomicrobiales bacterium]